MDDRGQENSAIFEAHGAIIEGNDLWMLAEGTDVLLHFDLISMKLLDYYIIYTEKIVPCAHWRMVKSEDNIYIAPYMERTLVFFNSISEQMGEIDIPYELDEADKKRKFNVITAWKSKLVLVGHAVRGIYYYDMLSGSFTKDIGYLEELKKAGCDTSGILFSDGYCQRENKLYLPVLYSNIVLEVDLEQGTNMIHKLRHEIEIKLRTIDGYEQDGKEKFLLTTANDEMLIWSPMDGVEKMKKMGLLCGEEKRYASAFHVRNKNYYIAAYERKVFVEADDRIRELEFEYESRGGYDEATSHTQFDVVFKNGTDIYFQARSNGQLFRIDTITDTIHRLDFDVTPEQKKEILCRVCNNRIITDMLVENAGFGLDNFLKMYICREER